MDFLTSRVEHLRLCYSRFKRNKLVAGITIAFAVYEFIVATIPNFVLLPAPVAAITERHLPKLPLAWAAVVVLIVTLIIVIEGSYRLRSIGPPSNLTVDWDAITVGPAYLTDAGTWSESSLTGNYKYLALRITVRNPTIEGRKTGTAKGVSGRVEFRYDDGSLCGVGAPAAWFNEKLGLADIEPGNEKQLLLASRVMNLWSTVSNVRSTDGAPHDRTAMQFRDAPPYTGTFKVSVICDGEAKSRMFSWDDTLQSATPKIRPMSPQARTHVTAE